jgi:putative FmdB family regulatory protein
MPFYEYECQACKFYSEVMQKITDPPLTKCPSCGKKALKKLVSAPVFRLKGSGWYETDFKSDKENKRNLSGGADKDEPKVETKVETKADAKADTKSEPKTEAKETKLEPKPAKEAKATEGRSAGGTRRGGRTAARPATRPKAKKSTAKGRR